MQDISFLSPYARRLYETLAADGHITVTFNVMNSRGVTYNETARRLTDEKFFLRIKTRGDKTDAEVDCSGGKSAFYALSHISELKKNAALTDGAFECAPAFAVRGYIEGFYGMPWTHETRLKVMRKMAQKGMNAVYYAPKDDPYHRENWRALYPAEALTKLKALSDEASALYMEFTWCIAPGLSICYSDTREQAALEQKTLQLYRAGVRSFGLLLDDIPDTLPHAADRETYGETVNAHIDLVNRYYGFLTELSPDVRLTVCPTLYHGRGDEYYISKLGRNIPPQARLFWTGRDICSREQTVGEALRFIEHTRHKPLYWDNYPVNDMAMRREMHLGPLIGRENDLYKYAEGFIMNAMEAAACACIPLATAADYLWAPEEYDPEASLRAAVTDAVGKENAEAFLCFADHLRVSCLMDENSPRLKELFFEAQNDFAEIEAYLNGLDRARAFLRRDLPLCRELQPWAKKLDAALPLLQAALAYIRTGGPALAAKTKALAQAYDEIPEKYLESTDVLEAAKLL